MRKIQFAGVLALTVALCGMLVVASVRPDPAHGQQAAVYHSGPLTAGHLIAGYGTDGNGTQDGGGLAIGGGYNFTGALLSYGNAAGAPTHIATQQGTAPALTSCGGGTPAIAGTDEAGIVTMGTSATGCVITFNVAYTGAPFCVVTWIATPLASQSYVTAAASITLTQTSASGNKVQYLCRAPAGG